MFFYFLAVYPWASHFNLLGLIWIIAKLKIKISSSEDHQIRFLIHWVARKDPGLCTFTAGVSRGESNFAAATVASQRVGALRMLRADPTGEAFINVWGAVEESEQTKD